MCCWAFRYSLIVMLCPSALIIVRHRSRIYSKWTSIRIIVIKIFVSIIECISKTLPIVNSLADTDQYDLPNIYMYMQLWTKLKIQKNKYGRIFESPKHLLKKRECKWKRFTHLLHDLQCCRSSPISVRHIRQSSLSDVSSESIEDESIS